MAKRFTDTGIWQDEWFMELPPEYKLAYMFIKDNCDQAGVWKPNKRLANMMIGCPVDWEDFFIQCGDRIKPIQGGYWWLTKFVDFQYGTLSENCKPHTKVLESLKKYDLLNRVNKGYAKGIHTLKEEEEYKEEDKDKEEEKDKGQKFNFKKALIEYGFNEKLVDDWIQVRKNKKATNSQTAFNGFVLEIEKRSCFLDEILKLIIEKSWSGFKWEWVDNLNIQNGKQNTDNGKAAKWANHLAKRTGAGN